MNAEQPLQTLAGRWEATDNINWAYWLGILLQGRWWVLGVTGFALLAGLLHVQLATPIYQSDALLQFESNKSAMALVDVKDLMQEKTSTATEIEIIRSRLVLGQTVRDLNLDILVMPNRFPVIGNWLARGRTPVQAGDTALFGFKRYAWGGERLDVAQLDLPQSWLNRTLTLEAMGEGQFRLKLPDDTWTPVLQVGQGHALQTSAGDLLVFVRSLQARPGSLFRLLRQPVDVRIGALQSALFTVERGQGTNLLDVRFEDPDPVMAQRILQGITNNYLRQNVERKSAEADQTLKFLDQQLPELKKRLDAAESSFNAFRTNNRTLNVTAEGENLLQQSVQAQTALAQLEQRRKELLQRFTSEHPAIQAVDGQIAVLRGQAARADGEVGSLPKLEQQMLQLMRDVKVANELYVGLLNSAQQLKVAKAGTVGNARIIDAASAPLWSVRPQKSKLMAVYLLAGLVLGVGLVLLRQLLKPGVKDARDIEQALGLPVYATVPRAETDLGGKRDRKGVLLAVSDAADPTVESLRSLRTALQFAGLEAGNQAMLIAGPAPNVGKSFIAANLAVVLAQTGQRVILVDGDMRRGHLHDFFGHSTCEEGLSDYLAGQKTLDQVLRPETGVTGLTLISTGAIPPNPSELLLHPRFDKLVRELCAEYDQVIFDAGPLLAVTDSAIIGRLCGTTLLVGRYEQTPLRELELAAQRLQQAGINLKGVVLNDVQKHGAYGYGYGYGYQYTYSYRNKDTSAS